MPDLRWIAFYEGGATFSWEDGPPEECPTHGLVVIAQESENTGHELIVNHFFLHLRGQWIGCDHAGRDDQLTFYGHTLRAHRIGRWVPNGEYEHLLTQAMNDPRLPRRSAMSPNERPVA